MVHSIKDEYWRGAGLAAKADNTWLAHLFMRLLILKLNEIYSNSIIVQMIWMSRNICIMFLYLFTEDIFPF